MRARFRSRRRSRRRFADLDRQHEIGELKIKISGCINACGHHHAGHIGILGVDKKGVEFYQLQLGGSGAEDATIGTIMGPGFGEHEIADAVERVVDVISRSARRANASSTPIAASAWSRSRHAAYQEPGRMTRLIKDGAYAEDIYARVADDAPLPDGAVRSCRCRASRRSAMPCWRATRRSASGCKPARMPELLGADVHRFSLVALEFPKFRDGRAFSWARMLRTRLGFTGEIRAVGDFLYDQIELPAPGRLRRLGGARSLHA